MNAQSGLVGDELDFDDIEVKRKGQEIVLTTIRKDHRAFAGRSSHWTISYEEAAKLAKDIQAALPPDWRHIFRQGASRD